MNSKELDKFPPVPSAQWARLRFVPNVEGSTAAGQFTGSLEAKLAVQTRTLRKEYMDQHWANSIVCVLRVCSLLDHCIVLLKTYMVVPYHQHRDDNFWSDWLS